MKINRIGKKKGPLEILSEFVVALVAMRLGGFEKKHLKAIQEMKKLEEVDTSLLESSLKNVLEHKNVENTPPRQTVANIREARRLEQAFQLIHELFNRGEDDDQLKLAENQLKITIRDKFVRYAEAAVNKFYGQRINSSVNRLSQIAQKNRGAGFPEKLKRIASNSRKFAINVLHRGETVQPERQQE